MKLTQYQKNRNVNFDKLVKRVAKDFKEYGDFGNLIFADALYTDLRQKRKLKIKRIK